MHDILCNHSITEEKENITLQLTPMQIFNSYPGGGGGRASSSVVQTASKLNM